jgi:hypothetical protein
MNVLFLDLDGVLHPDSVFIKKGRPTLTGPGRLFMWAPVLDALLVPYPDVNIVLSTSWCVHRGFSRAKRVLPPGLRERVISATWHSHMMKSEFLEKPRFHQILDWIARAPQRPKYWLAIDDDDADWADTNRDFLVNTRPDTGLASVAVVDELKEKLIRFAR